MSCVLAVSESLTPELPVRYIVSFISTVPVAFTPSVPEIENGTYRPVLTLILYSPTSWKLPDGATDIVSDVVNERRRRVNHTCVSTVVTYATYRSCLTCRSKHVANHNLGALIASKLDVLYKITFTRKLSTGGGWSAKTYSVVGLSRINILIVYVLLLVGVKPTSRLRIRYVPICVSAGRKLQLEKREQTSMRTCIRPARKVCGVVSRNAFRVFTSPSRLSA